VISSEIHFLSGHLISEYRVLQFKPLPTYRELGLQPHGQLPIVSFARENVVKEEMDM
jgi:hypothetical protein